MRNDTKPAGKTTAMRETTRMDSYESITDNIKNKNKKNQRIKDEKQKTKINDGIRKNDTS